MGEEQRFEKEKAHVAERRMALMWTGIGCFFAAALSFVAFRHTGWATSLVGPVLELFGLVCLVVGQRWARRREVRLVADSRGLELDGRLYRLRPKLRNGYVHRQRDGSLAVRVIVAGRFVDVLVDSEGEGQRLLEALRLDPSHAIATFFVMRGGMRARARRQWMMAGSTTLLGIGVAVLVVATRSVEWLVGGTLGFVVALVAIVLMAVRAMMTVQVGSDGVSLKRLLGATRFVGYDAIERATFEANDVVLVLRSGESVRLGVGTRRMSANLDTTDALARRIETARAVHAAAPAGGIPPQPATLVARGDRTTGAWLDALKSLADHAKASYRGAVLPRDQLWRMLEDVTSPPDVRAGAAVALRGALDPEGKARLQQVASVCASPRLRVALDAVRAEKDDRVIEEALASLEPEKGRQRAT